MNHHRLQIEIFPPLYQLSLLDESELKKLFLLPNKFTTKSILFNLETSLLVIEFQANEDIGNGNFLIDFNS